MGVTHTSHAHTSDAYAGSQHFCPRRAQRGCKWQLYGEGRVPRGEELCHPTVDRVRQPAREDT